MPALSWAAKVNRLRRIPSSPAEGASCVTKRLRPTIDPTVSRQLHVALTVPVVSSLLVRHRDGAAWNGQGQGVLQ
jgi:hypothetical protein